MSLLDEEFPTMTFWGDSLPSSCIMFRALPSAVLCCIMPAPARCHGAGNPWGQGETACSGHVLERWEHPGDFQSLSWEKCYCSTPFICCLDDSYGERILNGTGIWNFFLSLVLIRAYYKYMSIFTATELNLLLCEKPAELAWFCVYWLLLLPNNAQFTNKFTLVASLLPRCQYYNALLILSQVLHY